MNISFYFVWKVKTKQDQIEKSHNDNIISVFFLGSSARQREEVNPG